MNTNAYSLFDTATQTYSAPFFQHNNNAAIRMVKMQMQGQDSLLAQYPQDYELWHVGTFNTDTAEFTPNKERVVRLIDLKEQA